MTEAAPYEMLGQLPSRVPFARRYKVRHHALGKEVEFRVLPRSATEEHQRAFFGELDELLALDHPCFLPVLERGMVRQRQAYVVPLRDHRSIPQRISAHTFYPAQAYAAVTTLASGLAAQHERRMLSGPIDPAMIAWDDTAATAYHLQRRRTVPRFLTSGAHPFPEDVRDPELGNRRADVFHWGFFAYFLLSRGRYPYEDPGILVPLERHAPEVPRFLQVVVEAALCWRPEERPEHGPALQRVLLVGGFGGLQRPGPGGEPVPAEPVETRPADVEASRVFQAFLADVDELHMSTGAGLKAMTPPAAADAGPADKADAEPASATEAPPAPPAEETEPQVLEAGALEEIPLAAEDDPDLSMGVYQSGSGMRAVMPGATAPAPEEEPSTEFGAELQQFEETADVGAGVDLRPPAPATRVDWLVAAAGLAIGLTAGWVLRGEAQRAVPVVVRPPAPVQRPAAEAPDPEPRESSTGEAILALPPSAAAPFHKDDLVAGLLRLAAPTPETFEATWNLLRDLVAQKRLPPVMMDGARLVAMRKAFRQQPSQGVSQLQGWLEDLRTVLGPPRERQP